MATVDQIKDSLRQLLPALEAERDKSLDALKDAYARRDALIAQIQPLEEALRKIQKEEIRPGEEPLREVGKQIAEIHRVLGAKTMRNG